jgi:endonuclease/exonuclease/phosphatase family metal-dependent hydrolase
VHQSETVKICSWNIKDFGQTKSEEAIEAIADILTDFDIVAIQEVVAGYGGAQAVAKLHDVLDRKGWDWDYVISDPTFSSSYKTERYAFLWKKSRVKKIGDSWLEQTFRLEIDREPYYSTFSFNEKQFTLVNFHAITKSMQPETEIKYFKFLPANYPTLNLIFCGDFNCPQSHTVFNPLKKMGYAPVLENVKTSLKMACIEDECLSSEFDHFFFNPTLVRKVYAGIVPFYKNYGSLQAARLISDHVPVFAEFSFPLAP